MSAVIADIFAQQTGTYADFDLLHYLAAFFLFGILINYHFSKNAPNNSIFLFQDTRKIFIDFYRDNLI
jgi:hypothetical protein